MPNPKTPLLENKQRNRMTIAGYAASAEIIERDIRAGLVKIRPKYVTGRIFRD